MNYEKYSELIVKKSNLSDKLSASDFKAIKFAEGLYTEEEYAPIKEERAKLRQQIKDLDAEINELKSKL